MENKHYWFLKKEITYIYVAVTLFASLWCRDNKHPTYSFMFSVAMLFAIIE